MVLSESKGSVMRLAFDPWFFLLYIVSPKTGNFGRTTSDSDVTPMASEFSYTKKSQQEVTGWKVL